MSEPVKTEKETAIQTIRRYALRFWRWNKSIYLLVFLVPVLVMYVAYALFGLHPYGDGSALVLDLNGQYVYYYEAMHDAVRGDGSLIYDWSRRDVRHLRLLPRQPLYAGDLPLPEDRYVRSYRDHAAFKDRHRRSDLRVLPAEAF